MNWLNSMDPDAIDEGDPHLSYVFSHDGWEIRFFASPIHVSSRGHSARAVSSTIGYAKRIEDDDTLWQSLEDKRPSEYKIAGVMYVIAVDEASFGAGRDNTTHRVSALYGTTHVLYGGGSGSQWSRAPNGFSHGRPPQNTWVSAAVLFASLEPWKAIDADTRTLDQSLGKSIPTCRNLAFWRIVRCVEVNGIRTLDIEDPTISARRFSGEEFSYEDDD